MHVVFCLFLFFFFFQGNKNVKMIESGLFSSNLFLSPPGKRIFILNSQAKSRMVQASQGRGEAREASLGLVRNPRTPMSGLVRDGAKRFLRERGQAHCPRMLRTWHAQAAGARGGMVPGPCRAVADVQESVGRRLGVVMVRVVVIDGRFDAAVGELVRAAAVVQRLRRSRGLRLSRLRLRLQGRQRNGVIQTVLLLLCLLGRHLVQVHRQRVVCPNIEHSRRRRHRLQRVPLTAVLLRSGRARCR